MERSLDPNWAVWSAQKRVANTGWYLVCLTAAWKVFQWGKRLAATTEVMWAQKWEQRLGQKKVHQMAEWSAARRVQKLAMKTAPRWATMKARRTVVRMAHTSERLTAEKTGHR